MDSYGSFMARVSEGSGSLPVEGCIVRIRGSGEFNSDVIRSLITDNDGVTPVIRLPAPNVEYSLSSGNGEASYFTYDVTVTKEGFYSKRIKNVSVFAGVTSVLPVNLIPFVSYGDGGSYPRGNNDSTVIGNDKL